MNLRHLEGLVAIARLRSFSAAARAISLSQSALTQAIGRIESSIGTRLFDRGAAGAVATAAGDQLVRHAARALEIIDAAGRDWLPALRQPLARRVTMTQLMALAAVERAGSFRGGARAAGLAEPSIHRATRDLERSVGQALLVRAGSRLQVTPAATALARATRLARAEIESGLSLIAHGAPADRTLVIGAMPLVRAGLLPAAVAALCALEPAVRLKVVEGPYTELINALLDGELDMVLGALRDQPPPGAAQHRLFDDELVIVARAEHPLVRAPSWSAAALSNFPWAASPAGTPRRQRWEEMMRAAGVEPPTPRVECSSAGAIRGLLLQGDWLAMLSPEQFRIERGLGLLTPLGGSLPVSTRTIGITTRSDWQPDELQQALIDTLLSCAEQPRSAAGRQ